MIQELVEFGKRVTEGKSKAFVEEPFSIVICIDTNGEFKGFITGAEQFIEAPIVTEHKGGKGTIGVIKAKQGHARFLLDKSEEVLGFGDSANKKHGAFIEVLERYRGVQALLPVFLFYNKKNKNGLEKAIDAFSKLEKKFQSGNITFMVDTTLLLKDDEVRFAISKLFEEDERNLLNGKTCSICGTSNSPVLDETHGSVKMPKGQKAGSALVSYNEVAFESYGLKGNLNSSICRECARNYIEGLSFLLTDRFQVEGKEKQKPYYHYNHRINISDTTVALFWTRESIEEFDPFVVYDVPDASEVKNLIESVWAGKKDIIATVDTNMFYSCTLSSAAARIAVRDWTAISLEQYKKNLSEWFLDIEIEGKDKKISYCSLKQLINATQKDKKPDEKPKSDLNSKARIGACLWIAAIKGHSYKIPLEVLQGVLIRLWKGDYLSVERAAIIKLIINRNTNKNMKSTLDETNTSVAYLCGRLFAVIEYMQWKAIGSVNSSVKDRFFTAAASQPAYIFGTLLTKNVPVYQHKIGGYLAKDLNEIAGLISEKGKFPQRFTTIEQGEFALGYYFQRNHKRDNESSENINS